MLELSSLLKTLVDDPERCSALTPANHIEGWLVAGVFLPPQDQQEQ